jgi:hypothetical protein
MACYRDSFTFVTALLWKDKRGALMFSTYHNVDAQREERVVRRGVSEAVVNWSSPRLCVTTQHWATESADHYITSCGFTRKSLLFWLLKASAVNYFVSINCNKRKEILKPLTHLKTKKKK